MVVGRGDPVRAVFGRRNDQVRFCCLMLLLLLLLLLLLAATRRPAVEVGFTYKTLDPPEAVTAGGHERTLHLCRAVCKDHLDTSGFKFPSSLGLSRVAVFAGIPPYQRRSPTGSAGSGAAGGGSAGSGGGGGPVGATSGVVSPVLSLPWLQLLAVVLEAYPAGGCWPPQVNDRLSLRRVCVCTT